MRLTFDNTDIKTPESLHNIGRIHTEVSDLVHSYEAACDNLELEKEKVKQLQAEIKRLSEENKKLKEDNRHHQMNLKISGEITCDLIDLIIHTGMIIINIDALFGFSKVDK